MPAIPTSTRPVHYAFVSGAGKRCPEAFEMLIEMRSPFRPKHHDIAAPYTKYKAGLIEAEISASEASNRNDEAILEIHGVSVGFGCDVEVDNQT